MAKGYTNIPDWMLDLDLDVYETIILAIIYGFSQDGESCFQGTQNYLARKAKCSRKKVNSALQELVKNEHLVKMDKTINGVHLCDYKVSPRYTGCNQELQGCNRELHHNINDKVSINTNSIYKEKAFDFKSALIGLGIPEQVVDAWLKVRKNKRATNSEIAFNKIVKEIGKSGLTPVEAITIAVERSWSGFEADWVSNSRPTSSQPTRPTKESVFEHNLREYQEYIDKYE